MQPTFSSSGPLKKKTSVSPRLYKKDSPKRDSSNIATHYTQARSARGISLARGQRSIIHSLTTTHTHTHTHVYLYIHYTSRPADESKSISSALAPSLSRSQASKRERKKGSRSAHGCTHENRGWLRLATSPTNAKGERERERPALSLRGGERERGEQQQQQHRARRAELSALGGSGVGRGSLSLSPCALVMVYIWGPGRLAEGASPGALWLRGGHGPLRRSSSQSPAGRGRRAHVYSVVCVTTHPLIPRTRSISVALSVCLICRGKDR